MPQWMEKASPLAFARVGEQHAAWRGSSDYDPFLGKIVEEQNRWCMEYTALRHPGLFVDLSHCKSHNTVEAVTTVPADWPCRSMT